MMFSELVEEVSRRTCVSQDKARDIIKTAAQVIEERVLTFKDDVAIPGFGKFKRRVVKGGQRKVGGRMYNVVGRDELKLKSFTFKEH